MEKELAANILDHATFALQLEKITHQSLMDYGRRWGKDRLGELSFLIAQRCIDLSLKEFEGVPLPE